MKIVLEKLEVIRSDLWSVSKLLQIWTTNELKKKTVQNSKGVTCDPLFI